MLQISQHITRGQFSLHADLTLPVPGITAFFGPSGTGKTSLLRAIAGLDHYPGGTLILNGTVWQNQDTMVPVHQRDIAYIFQEDNLFPHLDVRANLEFAATRTGAAKDAVATVINQLELSPLLTHKPQQLSGGEKQKVALARALLMKPALLLMDEPLSAVDSGFKAGFLPLLKQLVRQYRIPVLYVSHATDEVAQIADTLVWFSKQAAPLYGPVSDMLTDPALPLAARTDAESVVEAEVSCFDTHYSLLHLQFAGGELIVSGHNLAPGTRVRLRIMAQDVSLTLQPQQDTSIVNICAATIIDLVPYSESQITVLLTLGATRLLARITRKSADLLGLQAGQQVFAQIKSVAVLQ